MNTLDPKYTVMFQATATIRGIRPYGGIRAPNIFLSFSIILDNRIRSLALLYTPCFSYLSNPYKNISKFSLRLNTFSHIFNKSLENIKRGIPPGNTQICQRRKNLPDAGTLQPGLRPDPQPSRIYRDIPFRCGIRLSCLNPLSAPSAPQPWASPPSAG